MTRQQNLCASVCDCWWDAVAIWTISWARFSPNWVINFVIHSAFSWKTPFPIEKLTFSRARTLSPIINDWSRIASSCKTYGNSREKVNGCLAGWREIFQKKQNNLSFTSMHLARRRGRWCSPKYRRIYFRYVMNWIGSRRVSRLWLWIFRIPAIWTDRRTFFPGCPIDCM